MQRAICFTAIGRATQLLDYLVDLGIASVRSNRLVDVGDLYLKGLHLKRRGGVARPKRN